MKTGEAFVRYALEVGALQLEERELRSGRISPYFFDSAKFDNGKHIYEIARLCAETIIGMGQVDVVFGPAYKGIPLVASTATVLWTDYNYVVGSSFNRKEVKEHGERGIVVGCSMAHKRVIIIDNAIAGGDSLDSCNWDH